MKFKRVYFNAEGAEVFAEGRRGELPEDQVQNLGLSQVPLRVLCVDLCVLCVKAMVLTSPPAVSIFVDPGSGKGK